MQLQNVMVGDAGHIHCLLKKQRQSAPCDIVTQANREHCGRCALVTMSSDAFVRVNGHRAT